MSDLLNKLGNKPSTNIAEGAGKKSEPTTVNDSTTSQGSFDRGEDLLSKTSVKKSDTADIAARVVNASSADNSTNPKSPSSVVEPQGSPELSSDWTADSALKEVKKLREENKAYRIRYQEQLDQVRVESEARLKQKEVEMASLKQSQAELDRIKADQEDKKRDLAEKVAHREAKLAEIQAMANAKEQEYQSRLAQQAAELADYKAQAQAEQQVYKSRVDEELGKIPDKYKDYASLLVKGAGDPREALTALTEAKLKGMFEDKSVYVNHSVPNAYDGGRASKERLEEADKARRSSMNSSQKIGEALKTIKSGTPNSAFRIK